jgi:AcrR family transcriptional regulator
MRSSKRKKKSYHHGDLREVLMNAAVELIDEQGLHQFSLRECARLAGVSHAAPYRHFEDKDALLREIARQGFEWLEAAGRSAIAGVEDARDRLDAYGIAYVRFAVEHPAHHRVMFTSHVATPNTVDPGAFKLLVETATAVAGPDAPEEAALAAWSLSHGMSMLLLDGRVPHATSAEAAEDFARRVFAQWRGPLGGTARKTGRKR